MATFKVGQRVRIVGGDSSYVGRCGIVESINREIKKCNPYVVRYQGPDVNNSRVGVDNIFGANRAAFRSSQLAPLTDPRASEFIADMVRFAHVAKTTKVTA